MVDLSGGAIEVIKLFKMTTAVFKLPTEGFGWVDLVEGFLQGAVVKLNDHYELQCDNAALRAVDALMAASRVFNIPYQKAMWPTNWTYVIEPLRAASATFDALMVCHIGSAWWSENWAMESMDEEEEEDDEEVEDAEEPEDAEEEDANEVMELLTRVRVRQEEEDSAPEVVDLGHEWDQDFMREAWNFKPDVDVKAKGFMYDAIEAKRAGVEDGSMSYQEDEREKEIENVNRMRDDFGLNRMWEAVWCLSTDTVGILQNYDKGYYHWHLGRYFGRSVVSVVTILDWCFNYPPLQQYFALMFQQYSDAYWAAKDENEIGHDGVDAPDPVEEADDTEPVEEDTMEMFWE